MSEEFEKRMTRLDQEIEKGRSWRRRLKSFIKKSGPVAAFGLGALLLVKAPVFAFLFLGATVRCPTELPKPPPPEFAKNSTLVMPLAASAVALNTRLVGAE